MSKQSLRTFYIVAFTQMLSILGSQMSSFAIGIWVFTETGNTTPLMIVGVMSFLPRMFLGSLAGVIADRFNRKRLIVISDALQALPTALLMLAFFTGAFELWMLYAAALAQGFFGMVQGPAIYASVTMLVPDEERDKANAILEVVGPAAGIAAPILGGTLYAFIGVAGVLSIDVISFFVAVGVISFVHIPQPKQSEESEESSGSMWKEMRAGFSFLWHRKPLLLLSGYFLLVNFFNNGVWRLMIPYNLARLDYNEALVGVLSAMSSVGLVVGGLIPIVWKGTNKRIHTLMPLMILATVGLMIFATLQDFWIMGAVIFAMMLPYKWGNALTSSLRQAKIPPDMQGRISGLTSQIAMFAIPITYIIAGPLVDRVLIPFANTSAWLTFEPYFGSGEAGAIGLYIFATSAILFAVSIAFYTSPALRNMEDTLKDYVPEEEIAEPETVVAPAPAAS